MENEEEETMKKTCGKCGSEIPKPGPCPVCEDKPFGNNAGHAQPDPLMPKPRGWNRATTEERAMMEKGCTCQENGFGGPAKSLCTYHSKPQYHGYTHGDFGRVHFLLKMPSGWLVGVPEGMWEQEGGELHVIDPGTCKTNGLASVHYIVAQPEETKEPPDDPIMAADAMSKFLGFTQIPPGQRAAPTPKHPPSTTPGPMVMDSTPEMLLRQIMNLKGRMLVMEESALPMIERAAGRALQRVEELREQAKLFDTRIQNVAANAEQADKNVRQDLEASIDELARRVRSLEETK